MKNKTKIENTKAKEKREKREEARETKREEKAAAITCARVRESAGPSEPDPVTSRAAETSNSPPFLAPARTRMRASRRNMP